MTIFKAMIWIYGVPRSGFLGGVTPIDRETFLNKCRNPLSIFSFKDKRLSSLHAKKNPPQWEDFKKN